MLMMSVSGLMFWRFFRLSTEHGGGTPYITAEGRTALNNHGKISYVDPSVYREAVRRQRFFRASVVATWMTMFGLILWYTLRLRKQQGEALRKRP